MTINLTISDSLGDSAIGSQDLGSSVSPGSSSDYQDLFISHDATVNAITDVSLYVMRNVDTSYGGSDPDSEFSTLMGWGDAATGGIKLSMTPDVGWTSGEFASGWLTLKNGYGDSSSQLTLITDAVVVGTPSSAGEIPVGGSAHVQLKVDVPSAFGSAGTYGFTFVVAYSATS